MKIQPFIKLFILVGLLLIYSKLSAQKKYYVSNKSNGKHQYATIHQALSAVDKQIKRSGYPKHGIEVIIKDGNYKIDKPITITKYLSGTKKNPLVIKAENPNNARFFGGHILDLNEFKNFNPKNAPFQLVDEKAASKIKVLDLKKTSIKKSDLGDFVKHGYGFEKNPYYTTPAMLWVDRQRMHLSRWPNVYEDNEYYDNINQFNGRFKDVFIKGAVSLTNVIDKGQKKQNKWYSNKEFLENGGGTFEVAFYRGNQWNFYKKNDEKIWLDGVLSASWEWEYTKIKSIENRRIKLASGSNRGLGFFRKVTHFHFENIPEELDTEGEYFIDREHMLLYFYAPYDAKEKTITLSTLEQNMFHVVGASNIKIEGLILEFGRGNAIFINSPKLDGEISIKSDNILVENCIIRNFNQWGVIIQNAQNSTVNNCRIYNMGAGGVKLGNETRSFSLVNENNLVSNCEIYDIAFDQKSQVPAITLAGNGNSARNNEIYNTPHFAVKMKYANNCITEKNYIHDLPKYHRFDGGAVYLATGNQFFNRGNKIAHNYFENISTNGAYLDNYTMGNYVYENVFYNVGNSTKGSKNAAVYIHGGGQNVVSNNIAINCPFAYKTGSHIIKAFNTTNYLNFWYNDAKNHFKKSDKLFADFTHQYPEIKEVINKLHESPKVILDHVSNQSIKKISSKQNRKSQLDMYDLKGANSFFFNDTDNLEWINWFMIRYQSSTFKNNIYTFTSDEFLPDFEGNDKGAKGAFKLGNESGVFLMAPYKLKVSSKIKKISNHRVVNNHYLKDFPLNIRRISKSNGFELNSILSFPDISNFKDINLNEIGINKSISKD